MKKLIGLTIWLAFFAWSVQAQEFRVDVRPYIQTTTLLNIATKIGNDTIVGTLTNIDSGYVVYGPGIPENTWVVTNIGGSDDSLVLNNAATATIATDSLSFGLLLNTAYVSGEWMGLPFLIYNQSFGSVLKLTSIVITDSSDQLGNTDIIFFDSYSGELGTDTIAVNIKGSLFRHVVSYISLTTAVDLGTVRILQKDNLNMAMPKGKLYGRLIAKSTPTFTSIRCLNISFRFTY